MSYLSSTNTKRFLFNKALRILLITDGLVLLAAAMLGPIYALFVERVGGDLLDASFAGGAFAITAGITVLISGRITDKLSNKKLIIVLGYLIVGGGFLFYTIVNSIWTLLLAQVIIGLGEAIFVPAFDAIYSQHTISYKSGTEWSAWESLRYFAQAAGALTGGVIVTTVGFVPLFVVMSVLCFASAAYIYLLPKKVL